MNLDVDTDNLMTYFGYLLKSFTKFKEKHVSHDKLAEAVATFKKLKLGPKINKNIQELEKRMSEVIEKEKQILTRQKKQENVQDNFETQINLIEKKLTKFIETKKLKHPQLEKIEQEVKQAGSIVPVLRKQIKITEEMYKKIKSSKKYTIKEKSVVEKRLKEMKKKLEKIEPL